MSHLKDQQADFDSIHLSEDHEVVSPVEDTRPRTDSPTLFRKNLKHHLVMATRLDNKEQLKAALQNYEEVSEKETRVLEQARNKLFILDMKDALNDAIKRKNADCLKSLLREIRQKDHESKANLDTNKKESSLKYGICRSLTFEMQVAKKYLTAQKAAEKRKSADSKTELVLNRHAMCDIASYRKPPSSVHSVLQATLLLFGEDEGLTSDWAKCKALVHPSSPNGLLKRLPGLNYEECNPELVARSQEILKTVEYSDILRSSQSAACFYTYTCSVIEKIATEGKLNGIEPANVVRQRVILNRPESPRTLRHIKMRGAPRSEVSSVVEIKVP